MCRQASLCVTQKKHSQDNLEVVICIFKLFLSDICFASSVYAYGVVYVTSRTAGLLV